MLLVVVVLVLRVGLLLGACSCVPRSPVVLLPAVAVMMILVVAVAVVVVFAVVVALVPTVLVPVLVSAAVMTERR